MRGAAVSTNSGGTGIGIAVALNIDNQGTSAEIGSSASVTASDDVTVEAIASIVPKSEDLPIIGTVAVTSFAGFKHRLARWAAMPSAVRPASTYSTSIPMPKHRRQWHRHGFMTT
ncbi:hypothetical protein LP419_39605 [Massilia sp. H-1]|nr:hypothetical protein LP419_39605 [Massilia sp. H-1]